MKFVFLVIDESLTKTRSVNSAIKVYGLGTIEFLRRKGREN